MTVEPPPSDPTALRTAFTQALAEAILRAEKRLGRAMGAGELAKRLKVSPASVYAYRRGTTLPSGTILDQLLIAFGITGQEAGRLQTMRDGVEVAQRTGRGRTPAVFSGYTSDLPRDTAIIESRQDELESIVAVLTAPHGAETGVVPVCVVSGLAGVGKTALAIRAAHRLLEHFPDGCLFLDMHGYAANAVLPAADALSRLLGRMGMPSGSVPKDPDERASAFREQLRGKHVLLVLDNALDAEHVRPLLPGDACARVLITSRDNLNLLEDVSHVHVQPLPLPAATTLLRRLIAALPVERIPADDQIEAIATQCHGLPLAIRIIAAYIRREPWPLTRPPRDSAKEAFDDSEHSPDSVFGFSVARLPSTLVSVFTLLGLHTGANFDDHAAAAITGRDVVTVRGSLRSLMDANLLVPESYSNRYCFHDLVRSFALRRAQTVLAPDEQEAATARMVDYYLALVDSADRLLTPHRHRDGMVPPAQVSDMFEFRDYGDALAQLGVERDNIVAAAHAAAAAGLDAQCWQIAFAVRGFAFIVNDVDLWTTTHSLALEAAARAGADYAEAVTRNNFGLALLSLGDTDKASEMYRKARELFARIGEPHGEYTSIAHHAWVHFERGDLDSALAESLAALEFASTDGTPRTKAIRLRDTALIEITLGRHLDAVSRLLEALDIFESSGLHVDAAMAYNYLGAAYRKLEALDQAHRAFESAAALAADAGSVLEEARAREGLGELALDRSEYGSAEKSFRAAIERYEDLRDVAAADRLRGLLPGGDDSLGRAC